MKPKTKSCSRAGGCYNNFKEQMGVYVISCTMHKKRYKKFLQYSDAADVKACKVPCIIGKKFSQGLICKMMKDKILSPNADMTPIEISINMSHYNCWQRVINSCLKYGLVLEDDVELKPTFVTKVNKVLRALETNKIKFSILFLWDGDWDSTKKKSVLKVGNMEVVKQMDSYNAGGVAYIISRDYCQFLIKKFLPIKWPQDILIGNYYKEGNHLALKMKYRKKDECFISPVLNMECGGIGGTGTQTTQEHDAPSVKQKWTCDFC
jgi:GR25 family glycosyltransferase involved in LPS biosynthesis